MKEWLKKNILVKDMIIYIVIAAIVFYIPLWIFLYYAKVTGNSYLYGVGLAYVAFWAGPFTPTIPVILAIAVFLKQIFGRNVKRKDDDDEAIS